jgi:Transposase IS4
LTPNRPLPLPPTTATTTTTAAAENVQQTNDHNTPSTGTVDTAAAPCTETTETAVDQPNQVETTGTMMTQSSHSTLSGSTRVPVVTVNNRHWYEGNCNVEVNGKHSSHYWKLQDQYGVGTEWTPGCDRGPQKKFWPIDYFMALFPKQQLQEMHERTSKVLQEQTPPLQPTSIGEVLKFFGILLIMTRFEFGKRSSLWATTGFNQFAPPANLGKTTGMSRMRFDDLWQFMVWSHQPEKRPEGISHKEWRIH